MKLFGLLIATALIAGCAGETREFTLWNGDRVTFPNGTVFGGASSDQISTLAEIFVKSHNESMKAIKATQEANRQTAQQSLRMLEDLSKRQGSGEITIFFNTGSSSIAKGSLEYERLVRFLDYLSRESHGRKVLLVSIGSASKFGSSRHNARLAERRAKAPIPAIEKYLVNIPHEFHRVYSIGDMYSPGDIPISKQKNYQHTRIIGVFETDDLPDLPN